MNSDFLEFILEQLHDLPNLSYRPMFGGHGLYQDTQFFAIIHQQNLYFKANDKTRQAYIDQGSTPFKPSEKQTLKNYYLVPADIIENKDELTQCAAQAVSL